MKIICTECHESIKVVEVLSRDPKVWDDVMCNHCDHMNRIEEDWDEYDTPDGLNSPQSTCCGWVPWFETELCSRCKEHCGWFEGDIGE